MLQMLAIWLGNGRVFIKQSTTLPKNNYLCIMEQLYKRYKQALASLYSAHEISIIFRACVAEVLQVEVQKTYFLADLTATPTQLQRLQNMLKQLTQHTPLQYVLGYEMFMDLRFAVTPDVLIPRPETAQLVEHIVTQHKHQETVRILDVGTGSGCIAISLAHYLPGAQVTAVDISEKALQVAQKNAHSIAKNVTFKQVDFLSQSSLLTEPFDVLVSNPPYITNAEKADMEANVLAHEPHGALFVPDNNPLVFYKAIAAFAAQKSIPYVYVEINRAYGAETCQLFAECGYQALAIEDMFGNTRFVAAQAHKNVK